MTTQIRHFVLTGKGDVQEFSAEQAALVASGAHCLPQFADTRIRYLQVVVDSDADRDQIRVKTAGASIAFDADGKVTKTGPTEDDGSISRFEHETVVQWALRDVPAVTPTFH